MDPDKNLCTGCGKPLDTQLDISPLLPELNSFYSEIVEDLSRPGYFSHRLCRKVISDTAFKAVDK